jgi:hypothetical protein
LIDNTPINTITFGDLDEIDTNQNTDYPLGHIDHEATRVLDYVKEFDFTVYAVEPLEEFDTPDAFGSRDNINYIYNTLDTVVEALNYHLRIGDFADQLIRLVGNVQVEPFKDRFENRLSGYAITFTVEVAKGYVNA